MEKMVIARKEHRCDSCGSQIKKGDKYLYGQGKDPRFDSGDNQIGIEYYNYRICSKETDVTKGGK